MTKNRRVRTSRPVVPSTQVTPSNPPYPFALAGSLPGIGSRLVRPSPLDPTERFWV